MSDTQRQLAHMLSRLFEDHIDVQLCAAVEAGEWPTQRWALLEQQGLVSALATGATPDWESSFTIAFASGRHHVPLPLVETLLGRYLLSTAGLEIPPGPLALVSDAQNPVQIPWGRHCRWALTLDRGNLGLHPAEPVSSLACNIAGEPRDSLLLHPPKATSRYPYPGALDMGLALCRSAQIAGAACGALELTLQYTGEREQFGRPIGRFQIIQQELARIAGQATAAAVASEYAHRAVASVGLPQALAEIAAAQVICAAAARRVAATAHQVHGAMGMTLEYRLQCFTRRLWAWRAEADTGRWTRALGQRAIDAGADGFWPLITDANTGDTMKFDRLPGTEP